MADFKGKVVIVTGAGDGIGRATARGLASADASVVLVDVKDADVVAADICANGGAALATIMDVRDAGAWGRLVSDTLGRFGTIDALVNNAGIAVAGDTVVDVSED